METEEAVTRMPVAGTANKPQTCSGMAQRVRKEEESGVMPGARPPYTRAEDPGLVVLSR